jgi:K(+)-stimulated pyrophosphate-energized sodium pump
MSALNRGYYVAAALALVGFGVATRWLLHAPERPNAWVLFLACGLVGIATSQAFVYITQYYTEYRYRPVKEIAESAQTGPATVIITGMAVALECTAVPTIVISLAIVVS